MHVFFKSKRFECTGFPDVHIGPSIHCIKCTKQVTYILSRVVIHLLRKNIFIRLVVIAIFQWQNSTVIGLTNGCTLCYRWFLIGGRPWAQTEHNGITAAVSGAVGRAHGTTTSFSIPPALDRQQKQLSTGHWPAEPQIHTQQHTAPRKCTPLFGGGVWGGGSSTKLLFHPFIYLKLFFPSLFLYLIFSPSTL